MSEESDAIKNQLDEALARNEELTRELDRANSSLEEVQSQWQFVRNLADSVPYTVYLYDRSLQVTLWMNRHIGVDLGYTPEQIDAMGENFMPLLLHPDDLERMPNLLKRWETVGDDETLKTTYRMKRADGSWSWFLGQDVVFKRSSTGEVAQFIGSTFNLDEQKKAEEERLKLERKLFHTQKLESLGVLAGGIAHDFNNLLVSILGFADLALTEKSESVRNTYIQEILTGANRSSDLAKLMLAYAGKGTLERDLHPVNDIIKEISDLMRAAISKKAKILRTLGEDLPLIECDATQLRQVFMNLITNASDAIGDRDGIIEIRTSTVDYTAKTLKSLGLTQELEPGSMVVIEVSDNGCGMDDETCKRLFDPFFTTKREGRGLGMAAVIGIVRSHGGAIHLTSEVGVGSTFTVILPPGRNLLPGSDTTIDTIPNAQQWSENKTILVVDDEPSVRNLCKMMLETMGFTTLVAEDGVMALTVLAAANDTVAAVILDMTMPRMDGKECLRAIRATQSTLPVLLASGYTPHEIEPDLETDPNLDFLQKPYDTARLNQRLHRLLKPQT